MHQYFELFDNIQLSTIGIHALSTKGKFGVMDKEKWSWDKFLVPLNSLFGYEVWHNLSKD